MTTLSDNERAVVLAVSLIPETDEPWNIHGIGRDIADATRQNLPDITDVTIARVLIQVAAQLGNLGNQLTVTRTAWDQVPAHMLVSSLSAVMGAAAAEFASLELECPPEGS